MPYYKTIRDITPKKTRLRTLGGLKRLREQLDTVMPRKTRDATLILGTWNIRNFDDNRFANGPRTAEDLHYLAEIISRFDVLAIQEICDDIAPLDKLMRLLGGHYDYIVTDVTEGPSGSGERLGYIFDKNKVSFQGIAGELVLPASLQVVDEGKNRQFARTPFMCSFQAGWFKFLLSTVHIYYGEKKGPKYERRVKEVDAVAKFLAKRAKHDDRNHILVGDFNILEPGSSGYNALKKHGFAIYQNSEGSNTYQTKFYDQISFRVRENELRFVDSPNNKGVLQYFDSIFRNQDFDQYQRDVVKTIEEKLVKLQEEIAQATLAREETTSSTRRATLTKSIARKKKQVADWEGHLSDPARQQAYYASEWRTYHASDHLPLWVELEIDFSDAYLTYLATL